MQQFPKGTTSADVKNLDGLFVAKKNGDCFKRGDIFELWEDDRSSAPKLRNIKTKEVLFTPWCFLAPAPKGFYYGGLEIGDMFEDGFGNKMKVLEVGKTSFLRSLLNNKERASNWVTYEEAVEDGYTISRAEEFQTKIEEFEKNIRSYFFEDGIVGKSLENKIIEKAKEIFGDGNNNE